MNHHSYLKPRGHRLVNKLKYFVTDFRGNDRLYCTPSENRKLVEPDFDNSSLLYHLQHSISFLVHYAIQLRLPDRLQYRCYQHISDLR